MNFLHFEGHRVKGQGHASSDDGNFGQPSISDEINKEQVFCTLITKTIMHQLTNSTFPQPPKTIMHCYTTLQHNQAMHGRVIDN